MTNTENAAPATDTITEAPAYVTTEATGTADLTGVTAYRYLRWVSRTASHDYSVNLADYSTERQVGVAALVDHGLISERRYASGRATYRLTDAGHQAIAAARAAADLAIIGQTL